MDWAYRIKDVQKHLTTEKIGGWLLYDFAGSNSLAREFLQIDPHQLISRRFFYWIPAQGKPVKILHRIEPHVLTSLPGRSLIYLKWQELEAALNDTLKGVKTVAMEFSPRCAIPYLSKVDGGMIDLIRSFSVEVVSSASFLQYYTCVLDEEQLKLHLEATQFLDQTAAKTWEKIGESLKKGVVIDEYAVREFIAKEMEQSGFIAETEPICAVNAHSADPHFEPQKRGSHQIKEGDFILIDLWCKKKHPKGIYGDITRVGFAGRSAPAKHQEIFAIVRLAQKRATDFVRERYAKGEKIRGYEVDQVCRQVIEEKGYGPYFAHRTGHNIYTKDHGPGAHIDSLETQDLRELIPRTCFSIEPGIYLPKEFGIRLEYDVFLAEGGKAQITGGVQEAIALLL